MGWGTYKPVFCRIDAEGRQSDPSFGSENFNMTVKVGPSIKHSRDLATIRVHYDEHTDKAYLYINNKLIIDEI